MGIAKKSRAYEFGIADAFLNQLATVLSENELRQLIADTVRELGFSHFALITHEDLRCQRAGQVDIRAYPEAISARIIGEAQFRRDPVMRGCVFAESAFLWSQLGDIITLDRRDRACLELGANLGLSEGISVPCHKHGHCLGSFTAAGRLTPSKARLLLGMVQLIGIFAFKHARRLAGPHAKLAPLPRLNPRPRDCVMLVGRGMSNKEVARALGLAPRTVDGYLRDARMLYGVTDRVELVVSAVLAGELSLAELR